MTDLSPTEQAAENMRQTMIDQAHALLAIQADAITARRQLEVLAGIATELVLTFSSGIEPEPALLARYFRAVREANPDGAQSRIDCADLHKRADDGETLARQTLDLLESDQWWRDQERNA